MANALAMEPSRHFRNFAAMGLSIKKIILYALVCYWTTSLRTCFLNQP